MNEEFIKDIGNVIYVLFCAALAVTAIALIFVIQPIPWVWSLGLICLAYSLYASRKKKDVDE